MNPETASKILGLQDPTNCSLDRTMHLLRIAEGMESRFTQQAPLRYKVAAKEYQNYCAELIAEKENQKQEG